ASPADTAQAIVSRSATVSTVDNRLRRIARFLPAAACASLYVDAGLACLLFIGNEGQMGEQAATPHRCEHEFLQPRGELACPRTRSEGRTAAGKRCPSFDRLRTVVERIALRRSPCRECNMLHPCRFPASFLAVRTSRGRADDPVPARGLLPPRRYHRARSVAPGRRQHALP